MGIFDHRSDAGLLHEHIRDEYDHNGSDCWSDYCSDGWKGIGYASSNAKLYGGPLDFTRRHLDGSTANNNAVIRVYETHQRNGDFKEW